MALLVNPSTEFPDSNEQWFTIREVAIYVQVSERTVRRWLSEGRLRRGGPNQRTIRIKRTWVDEFLEGCDG